MKHFSYTANVKLIVTSVRLSFRQGVALTGRNRTVPPGSVCSRTGHAPGPSAADRSRVLQTTTDDTDRHPLMGVVRVTSQFFLILPQSYLF